MIRLAARPFLFVSSPPPAAVARCSPTNWCVSACLADVTSVTLPTSPPMPGLWRRGENGRVKYSDEVNGDENGGRHLGSNA
ncbi:hypothetical protein BGW80DRAFT_1266502 [Lactifluus volemus]|nr:hypothetical protein BGW80DRAFT_1266502 [Lactifluus volemus]